MPVCRMPRAVPRRFFGKASRTRRPPAGVELAPVAPASTSRGTKSGKGATAATARSLRCEPADEQRPMLAQPVGGHAGRVRADDPAERERGDDQTRDEGREIEILLDVPGQREDALVDQGHAELHPHRKSENRPRRAVRLAAQRHGAVATHGKSSNTPTFGSVRGRAGPERQSPAGSRIRAPRSPLKWAWPHLSTRRCAASGGRLVGLVVQRDRLVLGR